MGGCNLHCLRAPSALSKSERRCSDDPNQRCREVTRSMEHKPPIFEYMSIADRLRSTVSKVCPDVVILSDGMEKIESESVFDGSFGGRNE